MLIALGNEVMSCGARAKYSSPSLQSVLRACDVVPKPHELCPVRGVAWLIPRLLRLLPLPHLCLGSRQEGDSVLSYHAC